ncbi:hypothetical protein [Chitinimonas lacunae]|uniref:Uncharacterized protein n=1 Tax=Chitinimonas lacunae TaxID=1963018 RepID=A0ABV8ML34_9NEIS
MSAKTITLFFPFSLVTESMLLELTRRLKLKIDELSSEKEFGFQFSAQGGSGKTYLLVEYRENDEDSIEEVGHWGQLGDEIKKILLRCQSSITIYYRLRDNAKEAILAIGALLGEGLQYCVVENGQGCLLTLDSIVKCLQDESEWSWERDTFPELPNVAPSEWR